MRTLTRTGAIAIALVSLPMFHATQDPAHIALHPPRPDPSRIVVGLDTLGVRVTFSLGDWGLTDIADARLGLIGLLHESTGDRAVVYRMDRDEPPSFGEDYRGAAPAYEDGVFIVSDFQVGNRNRLGGYFNAFAASPSSASVALARTPDGRRGLRLRLALADEGFCGGWIHLFDYRVPTDRRSYLDARGAATLSFWVRGAEGGEEVLLKIADAEWERREDALPVGRVAEFLPSRRVEEVWQQAVIPLDRLPSRIDPSRLASMVLEAAAMGDQDVYVSRLALSRDPSRQPPLPEPTGTPALRRDLTMATWVWNTSKWIVEPENWREAANFLEREGFNRIFLQLPGLPGEAGELTPSQWAEQHGDALRRTVADLHARGMAVFALDGFRSYALPEHHERVLTTVDDVIRYNEASDPAERFDGLHHDIEPYLLDGFHGARREALLKGYLSLMDQVAAKLRDAGLTYGVDIPFWYDAPDEITFQPVTVEYRGEEKPASQHVIDIVDEITLMDYRTLAYGADGTIRHARGELDYASERGKLVLVGLETGPLPDEDLLFLDGPPRVGFPPASQPHGVALLSREGDSVHVLLLPGEFDLAAMDEELSGWRERPGPHWWPVGRRVRVPASKISFAGLGAQRLEEVIEATAYELGQTEAFAGFAIHHLVSYRDLVEEP